MTWTTNSIREEEEKIMYAYEFVREYCERYNVEAKEPDIKMLEDGGFMAYIYFFYEDKFINWKCVYVDTFTSERTLAIDLLADAFRVIAKLYHWQW